MGERYGKRTISTPDPSLIRTGRDSGDLDLARCQLNHEENIECDQATWGPHLDHEEICSSDYVPVGLEELAPGRSLAPFRSRVDSIPLQDVSDCRSTNAVADIL